MEGLFGVGIKKKPLNAYSGKLAHLKFNKCVLIGIIFMNCFIWSYIPSVIIIDKSIIAPSPIKSVLFSSTQVRSEINLCGFVLFNSTIKDMRCDIAGIITKAMPLKQLNLIRKICPELFGSLVKVFSPVSAFAEDISDGGGNQGNNGSSKEGDDNIAHLLLAFTVGYALAAIAIRWYFKKKDGY